MHLIITFEREGGEEVQRVQRWQTCCQDWRWTRSSQLAWWPTCTAAPITILWHYVSVFLQFFVFWYLWENHREDLTKLGNKTATMLTATSNVSSISHWLNLAESIMLNQFVWNRMLWLTHFKSVSMGTLLALLGCAEGPRTTNVYLSAFLDDPLVNQLWNWYSIVWEGF